MVTTSRIGIRIKELNFTDKRHFRNTERITKDVVHWNHFKKSKKRETKKSKHKNISLPTKEKAEGIPHIF